MSLHLDHLSLKLASFTLQVSVNITAPITGLFGASGSGKTTLLEIIAGLRRPDQGSVLLHGRPLTEVSKNLHLPPSQRRVGYVPQDLALFPHLNAAANLHYGYRPASSTELDQPQPDRVIEILELAPLLARPIQQLSGGEQQRIALGRALLASPEILLLDEPLSSLDDRLKRRILPYFKAVHAEFHIPILYVTHSEWELKEICDDVLYLDRGQLVQPPASS